MLQIIIAGDSAGANLALSIISAALHPHEGVPRLHLETPLKGALLICPWVTYETGAASHTENREQDVIPIANLNSMATDYRSHSHNDEDPFFAPLVADHSWWQGAPVSMILSLAGEEEIFRDDILELGKSLEQGGAAIKTVVCKEQIHIEAILDSMSGLEHGPMSTEIWEWLSQHL